MNKRKQNKKWMDFFYLPHFARPKPQMITIAVASCQLTKNSYDYLLQILRIHNNGMVSDLCEASFMKPVRLSIP